MDQYLHIYIGPWTDGIPRTTEGHKVFNKILSHPPRHIIFITQANSCFCGCWRLAHVEGEPDLWTLWQIGIRGNPRLTLLAHHAWALWRMGPVTTAVNPVCKCFSSDLCCCCWSLLYSVILRFRTRTHCARMIFYMSEKLFIARFLISTEVVYLQRWPETASVFITIEDKIAETVQMVLILLLNQDLDFNRVQELKAKLGCFSISLSLTLYKLPRDGVERVWAFSSA